MDISKAGWRLFRERICGWQEAYMEKLNRESMGLLSGDEPASKKFWTLVKGIRHQCGRPGELVCKIVDPFGTDAEIKEIVEEYFHGL